MNINYIITKKCVYRVCRNDTCRMFRLWRVLTLMNLRTFVYMIMNGTDYSIIHGHLTSKRGHDIWEFFIITMVFCLKWNANEKLVHASKENKNILDTPRGGFETITNHREGAVNNNFHGCFVVSCKHRFHNKILAN